MRFKKYVKEATYKGDLIYRQEAIEAWKKFMDYIRQGHNPRKFPKYTPNKGILIPVDKIGYDDLAIILFPGRGTSGFSKKGLVVNGKKYKVIMIPGLKELYDDLTVKSFKNKTWVDKQTFVHEFIHYLDEKRQGEFRGSVQAYKTSGNIEDYYNNPSEFNAFFQEIISLVEEIIKTAARVDAKDVLDKWLSSFKSFDKTVKSVFKRDATLTEFFKKLNKKYRQKYLKRLYTFYEVMVNTYYK